MRHRFPARISALIAMVILALLAQIPVAGQEAAKGGNLQTAASASNPFITPRTAWGDPDLEGVFTFATLTPFQRPAALAGKDRLTQEEQKALEAQLKKKQEENIATNEHFSYNALWFASDQGRPTGRTSIIVDPEDGRLPPLTERGEKLRAEIQAHAATKRIGKDTVVDTWEDLPIYDRCIARPMPRVTQEYNQGAEILQTPGYVTIFYESMHDVRVIPLDGRPHLDSSIRQWNGDSRGHWEGDTLVVDWTNFSDEEKSNGSTPFGGFPQGNMHVIERFRKINANTLDYLVTVEDPTIWTRPFTFDLPWRGDDPTYRGPDDLFEFACHEGNYRMVEDVITAAKAVRAAKSGTK
ncbi:MAG TPA: hypothetical protein VH640_03635 [Bryobacteraceae bacterium]